MKQSFLFLNSSSFGDILIVLKDFEKVISMRTIQNMSNNNVVQRAIIRLNYINLFYLIFMYYLLNSKEF